MYNSRKHSNKAIIGGRSDDGQVERMSQKKITTYEMKL